MTSEAVDLRGLDPPGPLLHILDALDGGGAGPFVFLLARDPLPLYPLIAAQGWRHATRAGPEGYEVTVYRNAAKP